MALLAFFRLKFDDKIRNRVPVKIMCKPGSSKCHVEKERRSIFTYVRHMIRGPSHRRANIVYGTPVIPLYGRVHIALATHKAMGLHCKCDEHISLKGNIASY